MKLAHIARMSPSALADRMRQEQLKLLERLHIVGTGETESNRLGGAPQRLLDRFRQDARERFFLGAVHADTPALIAARVPDARDAVLHAAAKLAHGRFDLLGYHDLVFGEPVDWHLDPVSGTRAPWVHWSRIDPLDRASVGDHKVVWELNRHQWLLHWAQARAFTRDERYAERCVTTLERWLRANPPGRGVNWASSLELAMRLISWSWTLVLLRESPALQPEFFARVLGAMHAHAIHIARHLSTTFSPNTHLLGEALGLFYAGVLLPESEDAAAWRATAQRVLSEQSARQILPDGVCFEQATCYQRYTAEMYMHFLILAERSGVKVPAGVAERVERCVDYLLAIRRADGSVPQLGDGDGGWLLPLLPRKADDMRGVFALAGALFGRGDLARAAGGSALEVAWLLGPHALHDLAALPAAPEHAPSRLFKDGGVAVLRSDFGPHAHQLLLDVGPFGCPSSGAHGHADLLALTCDIFGEPCIVDPGMPTYGGDPEWRDAFRSTALHSSVVVDGHSQASPSGPFSWSHRPDAKLRSWVSCDAFDAIDGEHDAYRFGRHALTHRRRVIFVKPNYWVVIDDLDETRRGSEHRIEMNFQFAPHHTLGRERDWVRVVTPTGHALLMRVTADVPLDTGIHEGQESPLPIRGWFSPAYGNVQPAPALVVAATTRLPLRLTTWLLPTERADAPLPGVFPPASDAALLQRLCA